MPQVNTSFCGKVGWQAPAGVLVPCLLELQPRSPVRLVPHRSACSAWCVLCLQIPSNPLYTQYLNPYLNQKSVDTPLSLPACLPGTDQPGPAVPGPPMGTSPAAPPPLPSTESSSSSSDVGIIIGAIAGAVAAIGALLERRWGGGGWLCATVGHMHWSLMIG